jgi:hypothetical protein
MRWCSLLCLGLMALAGVTGCGSKGSGPAPTKVEIPKTPEGTVTAVTGAIADGKFEVIWQAMPESYQGKVKHLLEEVAEHTDAEVYNKVMAVVGKFVKVLSDKQEYIVGTEMMKQQIAAGKATKEEAKEAITAVAGLLGDFQKDIKTKDDLEKLNVEKYLANIGSRIKAVEPILAKTMNVKIGDEMAKLKKIKVTAKEVTTDTATVEITDADGKTTTDQLVRVEGKWVPKKMAEEFPKKLDELGEQLHHNAELSTEQKAQFLTGAAMAEGFLDTMLKASSQEEFNAAIAPIMLMTGMGGGMPQPQ